CRALEALQRRARQACLRLLDLLSRGALRRADGRPLPAARLLVSIASRAVAAILLAALAAGCDKLGGAKSPSKAIDVTGAPIGGELRLTDHNGEPRTLADFRGKVVLVNFGYTQCPDVCPTTLADLASAMKKLGADASQVQVLFVTVDPKRDKPELLREYLPA